MTAKDLIKTPLRRTLLIFGIAILLGALFHEPNSDSLGQLLLLPALFFLFPWDWIALLLYFVSYELTRRSNLIWLAISLELIASGLIGFTLWLTIARSWKL